MKIGQLVNKIPVEKLHKPSNLLVDSATLLGAEIEVENCVKFYDIDAEARAGYWTHKVDHSLRNNGREFVFTEPLFGADAVDAIDFICAKAEQYNWKISTLTGIHTHVDVREMELNPFRNFCIVYSLTEPLIYNWVGNGRARNIFCMPWFMAEGDLNIISDVLKERYNKEIAISCINKLNKYSGLNLGSLTKFGTVEFRMLRTTFDKARIIDWFNILLSLKKYALEHADIPSTQLYKHARDLGAFKFTCDVFGEDLVNRMWYPGYSKHMISLGGPIADWFIDNSKDIFLKNGSIYEWARQAKLGEDYDKNEETGTHNGLIKFRIKNSRGDTKSEELKTSEETLIFPNLSNKNKPIFPNVSKKNKKKTSLADEWAMNTYSIDGIQQIQPIPKIYFNANDFGSSTDEVNPTSTAAPAKFEGGF